MTFGYLQAQQIAIIPQPQELRQNQESFQLNANTSIQINKASIESIQLWLNQMRTVTGFQLPIKNKQKENVIIFQLDSKLHLPSSEAYTIRINSKKYRMKKRISYTTLSFLRMNILK